MQKFTKVTKVQGAHCKDQKAHNWSYIFKLHIKFDLLAVAKEYLQFAGMIINKPHFPQHALTEEGDAIFNVIMPIPEGEHVAEHCQQTLWNALYALNKRGIYVQEITEEEAKNSQYIVTHNFETCETVIEDPPHIPKDSFLHSA